MKLARVAGLSLVIGSTITAGWALAGIEGSKHDFSNQAWAQGDLCGACHSPHRDQPPKAAPLWNPKADLTRRFGTPTEAVTTTGRGTLMCLRCHDGTIAKDSISAKTKDRLTHKQHPGLFGAGGRTSEHPVGVDYPQFDKRFRPVTTVLGKGTVALPDGKVACTSCHDPHNTSGVKSMLVTSNVGSALCLTCHKK